MINHHELKRQSDRILRLIDEIEQLSDQEELQSHFAKYICVLCSGFMENAVRHLYSDYVAQNTASPSIRSFTASSLSRIRNPDSQALKDIAKNFNAVWGIELNSFMIDDERSAAINYIMRERGNIAHGKDSDITLIRIRNYHMKCLEVARFIENQCGLSMPVTHSSPNTDTV